MRFSLWWLAAFLVAPAIVSAQSPVSLKFQEALAAARSPLLLTDNAYSGPGAAVLNEALSQSRFVLVGEDHATREIPQFVSALCDEMHPDAYAVEAGPFAAQYVNGLLHSSDRVATMTARDREYPDNMAFLNIRQENDLAAHCAASSRNPHFALWGLDQEYLGSAGVLLAQLAHTNPGPKSRAAIAAAQTEEHADAEQALQSGKFDELFLLSPKSADAIKRLDEAVAVDGKPQTREIDKELSESSKIYTLHEAGDMGATFEARAQVLKQHFLMDDLLFRAQNPSARILFKLGDNHTVKGFNETHDLNLGDFVAEVAAAEQARSLHILTLGLRGMHYTVPAYGKPMDQEAFVMSSDPYYAWMGAIADSMIPQPAGNPGAMLMLFDLRKLRYRHLALPPEWERVIYSNDLLVVFPTLSRFGDALVFAPGAFFTAFSSDSSVHNPMISRFLRFGTARVQTETRPQSAKDFRGGAD